MSLAAFSVTPLGNVKVTHCQTTVQVNPDAEAAENILANVHMLVGALPVWQPTKEPSRFWEA